MTTMDFLNRAVMEVRKRTSMRPSIALVLGSGVGGFAEDAMEVKTALDYGTFDGFPAATADGHRGRLLFGCVDGIPVAALQGRVHFYEGYSVEETVLPIRLLRLLGAKVLILTNASGGINPEFAPGDFVLVTDHISCLLPSPLRGANPDALGPRFPDMTEVYDRELRTLIEAAARAEHLTLRRGVYLQTPGPQFETPAEIRVYTRWGADLVGMSSVTEAIAARHCGMRVCAISCVANQAAGISPNPLSAREIFDTADRVAPDFRRLLRASLRGIGARLSLES